MNRAKKTILVGLTGCGKTTFVLATMHEIMHLKPEKNVKKNIKIVDLKPPKVQLFFARLLDQLKDGKIPDQTLPGEFRNFELYLSVDGCPLNLSIQDVAGLIVERLGEDRKDSEIKKLSRDPYIRSFMKTLIPKSTAVVVMVDPTRSGNGAIQQDRVLNNILLLIYERLRGVFIKRDKVAKKVLCLITKSDLYPEIFDDPHKWLRKRYSILYHTIKNRFEKWEVMAVSSYGLAEKRIADDKIIYVPKEKIMRPIGIIEALQWLAKN